MPPLLRVTRREYAVRSALVGSSRPMVRRVVLIAFVWSVAGLLVTVNRYARWDNEDYCPTAPQRDVLAVVKVATGVAFGVLGIALVISAFGYWRRPYSGERPRLNLVRRVIGCLLREAAGIGCLLFAYVLFAASTC
jgi:hypothetical protein